MVITRHVTMTEYSIMTVATIGESFWLHSFANTNTNTSNVKSEPSGLIVTKLGSLFNNTLHFQAYTLAHYPYTFRIRLSVTLCLILPRFAIKCTYCRISTWRTNISFIKKKTENMRKMRQNAAFRIQQGENLWKLKYYSSATATSKAKLPRVHKCWG